MKNLNRNIPKCLTKVNQKYILDQQLDFFLKNKITKIHLFLGFGHEQVVKHIEKRKEFDFVLHIEEVPLGTGGGFVSSLQTIFSDLLLVHGDLFLDFPLESMINPKSSSETFDWLQLVHPSSHMHDSDIVEVDKNLYIKNFHLKPHDAKKELRNLCNAGIYFFPSNTISKMRHHFSLLKITSPIDLDRFVMPMLLQLGLKGLAIRNKGFVKDIGTIDRIQALETMISANYVQKEKPIVFLDRDGVINEDSGLIKSKSELKIFPMVDRAIAMLNRAGYWVCVVTNQPVVARGLASIEDIQSIHNHIDKEISFAGAFIDEYYFCPHHPDSGFLGENLQYKIDCSCRKPKIDLFRRAFEEFPSTIEKSILIGDSWRDKQAAEAAKLFYIEISQKPSQLNSFLNLHEAVEFIIKNL